MSKDLVLGSDGAISIPGTPGGLTERPFSRDIFLLETIIAGTSHRKVVSELFDVLVPGTQLNLFRDTKNEYDSLAIAIKTDQGIQLGFVPQAENEVLAHLLDGGKRLSAVIKATEMVDTWPKITIEILLMSEF